MSALPAPRTPWCPAVPSHRRAASCHLLVLTAIPCISSIASPSLPRQLYSAVAHPGAHARARLALCRPLIRAHRLLSLQVVPQRLSPQSPPLQGYKRSLGLPLAFPLSSLPLPRAQKPKKRPSPRLSRRHHQRRFPSRALISDSSLLELHLGAP